MKIIFIVMTFIIVNLYANENWIKIETQKEESKPKSKVDVNLSQIEPLNKMLRNITLIQKIIRSTDKKETKKQTTDGKNWFVINR